jgi:hypothetical protein
MLFGSTADFVAVADGVAVGTVAVAVVVLAFLSEENDLTWPLTSYTST